MLDYALTPLRKYADFNGRARRAEFWWYTLAVMIVSAIVQSVDSVAFGQPGLLTGILSLALLIPGLAVGARRLHDTDRSGWWLLIGLIPLVGFIVLLVFWISDGTPGPNKFGPSPKGLG